MKILSKRNAVVVAVVVVGSIAAFGSALASSEDEDVKVDASWAVEAVATQRAAEENLPPSPPAAATAVGAELAALEAANGHAAPPLLPPTVDENGLEVKIGSAQEPPRFVPGGAVRIYPDTPEGLKYGLTGALEDQTTLLCRYPNGNLGGMEILRRAGATGDPFPPQNPNARSWERPC